jgi:hypothetical protein
MAGKKRQPGDFIMKARKFAASAAMAAILFVGTIGISFADNTQVDTCVCSKGSKCESVSSVQPQAGKAGAYRFDWERINIGK